VSVATRITTDVPPGIAQLCGLDPHVDAILLRGLAKAPGDRFPSARELGEALAEALGIASRKMQPTLPDEHHRRAPWQAPPERHGLRNFVGGVAVGALLGVAALQLSNLLREPEASHAEPVEGGHLAVAYLAEKPAPKRAPEATASASSNRKSPHPASSAPAPTPAASAEPVAAPSPSSDAPDDVP
jgi:hypothetical protein